jgi:hypothetical protein
MKKNLDIRPGRHCTTGQDVTFYLEAIPLVIKTSVHFNEAPYREQALLVCAFLKPAGVTLEDHRHSK